MASQIRAFMLSVGFLTIVPVPLVAAPTAATYPRATRYFPLVGALIGLAVGAFDALLGGVLPATVVAVFDLVALAVLSGGLHLDGLGDTADGLFAGGGRDHRLAAMRDSRSGAFGVATVALVLLLEAAALSSISTSARPATLVAAGALSRWSMCVALWSSPSARADGLGASFKSGLRAIDALIATALTSAIAALVLGLAAIAAIALVGVLTAIVVAMARSRIGGVTGDVCGGIGELAFAGQLVLASALTR